MKKFYITTSIAYTNASPHIGFALELIQADVMARHKRRSREVWFLTGTDEHGSKIVQKAKEQGKSPNDFCDEISKQFRELTELLQISNDDFIRTTDQKKHWPGVYHLWKKLEANGDIYEKNYEGLYCIGCESFIKEKDLIDGKCQYHLKKPDLLKEKNYFFRLSKYLKSIKEKINNDDFKIYPETKKNETLSLIDQELDDISFSRPQEKVKWGIPVPDNPDQLIYVWGDALVNYISAVGYGRNNDFLDYWPADIHFIGKDILKFHAIIWPAMLLSAEIPLPKKIFIHGFLNVEGRKMSKSLGNVIDPFELIEKYGSDAVRYFFLREINPTEDGDFSYAKFKERYNSDLAGGLGNLFSRVMTLFSTSKIDDSILIDSIIENMILKTQKKHKEFLEDFKFNSALSEIWDLIHFADKYIEDNKPWEKERLNREIVLKSLIFLLKNLSEMIYPFMPETSFKISEKIKNGEKIILFKKNIDNN